MRERFSQWRQALPGARPKSLVRIVIADDQELLRTGIATVLARQRRYSVCGFAANERRALELAEQTKPQLLLLDLFLANRDGIALIKELSGRFPQIRILVLSDRAEETLAARALRAGASGYVMKSASAAQLLEAIEHVLKGKVYIAPRDRLLSQHGSVRLRAGAKATLRTLTDRELHVFQLIGLGLGTSSIARELGLSRKTIEYYKERIKNKLTYADAGALARGAREWLSEANETDRTPAASQINKKDRGKPPMRHRRRPR